MQHLDIREYRTELQRLVVAREQRLTAWWASERVLLSAVSGEALRRLDELAVSIAAFTG